MKSYRDHKGDKRTVHLMRELNVEFTPVAISKGKQRLKTGYHLTTLKNWKSIQKTRKLLTYLIDNEEIFRFYNYKSVNGIWIWTEKPYKTDTVYRLIYHFLFKRSFKFVLLKVKYSEKDIMMGPEPGQKLKINHRTILGDEVYIEKQDNST